MRLPFHPEALAELDDAVAWLERERAGWGGRLFEEVSRRVGQAARFPRSGSPVLGFAARHDVRAFAVRGFAYRIVTAIVAERRTVVAVAHTKREPGYWRKRLG